MMANATQADRPLDNAWLTQADGMLYTQPQRFTIERLQNGRYRLFHYGPNMSGLYETLAQAKRSAQLMLWNDQANGH